MYKAPLSPSWSWSFTYAYEFRGSKWLGDNVPMAAMSRHFLQSQLWGSQTWEQFAQRHCAASTLRDIQSLWSPSPKTHPLSLICSLASIPQNLNPWVSAKPSHLTHISDSLSPPAKIPQVNFLYLQGTGDALEGAEVKTRGVLMDINFSPPPSV